jgi:hypothetical protein
MPNPRVAAADRADLKDHIAVRVSAQDHLFFVQKKPLALIFSLVYPESG